MTDQIHRQNNTDEQNSPNEQLSVQQKLWQKEKQFALKLREKKPSSGGQSWQRNDLYD